MNPYNSFQLIGFSINNFRVFGKETDFDFAPLTILTGVNSSGKSSLLKALNLLKKSYQTSGLKVLDLMDYNLKLGGINAILNRKTKSNLINFSLKIKANSFDKTPTFFELKLQYEDINLSNLELIKDGHLIFNISIDLVKMERKSSFIDLPQEFINEEMLSQKFKHIDDANLKIISTSLKHYFESHPSAHSLNEMYGSDYSFKKNQEFLNAEYDEIIRAVLLTGQFKEQDYYDHNSGVEGKYKHYSSSNPQFKDVNPELSTVFGIENEYVVTFLNRDIIKKYVVYPQNMISTIFDNIEFIPSIRANQEMVYTPQNAPNFYPSLERFFNEKDVTIESFLSKWFNMLVDNLNPNVLEEEFHEVFRIKQIDGLGYTIELFIDGVFTDLSKLGYGFAQLVPIILRVGLDINNSAKLFIVEEPESNLHPSLQSRLADFFFGICKEEEGFLKFLASSHRFIIETHSEYMIRKLQYLTASPKSEMKPDDVLIYYFYHPTSVPPGYPQIRKINISKEGGLSHDFGSGFFDEADNISLSIWSLNSNLN